jgi:hypothetical protein
MLPTIIGAKGRHSPVYRKGKIMAQKVLIQLEDDLDGSEATETVTFGLDGRTYEIDLNEKNATKLRKAVQPFADKARKVTGTRSPGRSRASGSDAKAIREWAQSSGLDVPSRGRIPASVREAYEAAN